MAEQIAASIVRVLAADGRVAGAGFLVSPRHVLTCAHVVAEAIGVAADAPTAPDSPVRLDFPLTAPGAVIEARVAEWRALGTGDGPPPADGEDIAALELAGMPPEGSRPIRLTAIDELWGHTFRAFGFPTGYDDGVWATGVIRAAQADGWIQIEGVQETGYFVAPGFSGGPVWSERAGGVVGMVVSADRRADIRAAFIIPTDLLVRACPTIARQPLPPCPYRGLQPFREEDARFFFGRTAFTEQLVKAVRSKLFVAVIGASGSGKSSVVYAGLIPRLRNDAGWLIATLRPGDRPLAALAAALLPLLEPELGETDRLLQTGRLAEALRGGELALSAIVRRVVQRDGGGRRLLLVVDQSEELYTVCREVEERRAFVDVLLAAIRTDAAAGPELTVVSMMRADFVGHALGYRPLADALQHADLKLGPMSRHELEEAVVEPARMLGVQIEDGLTERILDAVCDGPGDLPLLEFALTRLWARQQDGELTHEAYDEIGGVERAIATYADEVYDTLDPDQQRCARQIFLQLVRPGQGTQDTRRVATRQEVGEKNLPLVARLASGRLVVTGRDDASGKDTVEIVHEALIGRWERLAGWMAEGRAFRIWQERLRAALEQWEATEQDEGALLRGAPLVEAAHWMSQPEADLSAPERAFVEASLALRAREQAARQRDRRRRLAGWIAFSAVMFVLLAATVVLAWSIEQQRQLAFARQLAEQALTHMDDHVDLALLLAVEANRVSNTVEARGSLLYGLAANGQLVSFLRKHESAVRGTAFTSDGRLLSVDEGGAVLSWDPGASGQPATIPSNVARISSLASSRDGRLVAWTGNVGWAGRVELWDAAAGRTRDLSLAHEKEVSSVALSPDGRWLAAGAKSGVLVLWDLAASPPGRRLLALQADARDGDEHEVLSLAFGPNGDVLAAGARDNLVRVWDLTGAAPPVELEGHTQPVRGVAISPDGRTLASASEDGTVRIWELPSGRLLHVLTDHTDQARSVAFSPDGSMLASGGRDNKVILWEVATGRPLGLPLTGHTRGVWSVAFSPDGMKLATGGQDTAVIVWDVSPARMLAGHAASVNTLAFSPDGRLLASGDEGSAIILWDVGRPRPARAALSHCTAEVLSAATGDGGRPACRGRPDEIGVLSVAFSPDGRWLASGGRDRRVVLWDLSTTPPTGRETGRHRNAVKSVVFSSDGKHLLSGGRDNRVHFWDLAADRRPDSPPVRSLESPNPVFSIALGRDGRRLAAGTRDDLILVWNLAEFAAGPTKLERHQEAINSVAISPDGRTLASGSGDASLILWDLEQGGRVSAEMKDHVSGIESVTFSPDGTMLASGSSDQSVILWDPASRRTLGLPLRGHTDWISSVAFSPDGKVLASSSQDRRIVLWNVDADRLAERACAIAGRSLSPDEWRQHVGGEPPADISCRRGL